MQCKNSRIASFHRLFEIKAESRNAFSPREIGLRSCVPELAPKAANVIALAAIAVVEPRHVHVCAANPIIVLNRRAFQFRSKCTDGESNLFGEIASNDIG